MYCNNDYILDENYHCQLASCYYGYIPRDIEEHNHVFLDSREIMEIAFDGGYYKPNPIFQVLNLTGISRVGHRTPINFTIAQEPSELVQEVKSTAHFE